MRLPLLAEPYTNKFNQTIHPGDKVLVTLFSTQTVSQRIGIYQGHRKRKGKISSHRIHVYPGFRKVANGTIEDSYINYKGEEVKWLRTNWVDVPDDKYFYVVTSFNGLINLTY